MDSEAPTVVDRRPPRVLVVEDDAAICRLFVRVLSRWGYLVTTAGTVDEAVQAATNHPPDVLVLDLHLRGHDGLEVLQRLPEGNTPMVLACTGREDLEEAPPGVAGVVRKPFRIDRLLAAVHELARMRPASDREEGPAPGGALS